MSAVVDEKEEMQKPPRRPPYQYSPNEIGEALALVDHYGGNIWRAATQLRYPYNTVKTWYQNPDRLPSAVVNVRTRKREEFAELSDDIAQAIAESITPQDLEKAGLRDKAVAYGIFRDKSAQDRGEATSIVEHRGETAKQALERLFELARVQRPDVTKAEVRATLIAKRPELASVLPDE